jgi:hypothetical protein
MATVGRRGCEFDGEPFGLMRAVLCADVCYYRDQHRPRSYLMSLDLKVTLKAHITKWRERFVNVKPSTTGCYLHSLKLLSHKLLQYRTGPSVFDCERREQGYCNSSDSWPVATTVGNLARPQGI